MLDRVVRSVLKNWNLHSDSVLLLPASLRQFSSKNAIQTTDQPFALSYLINECGVHPKNAAAAIKYVRFKTPHKANVVLQFLRNLGISSSQIPQIIGRRPALLVSDPEKRFVPKIRFLENNGFSPSDISQILLRAPDILHSSVENQLLPNLNFIKGVIQSEEKVICAIRRGPFLLTCTPKTYVIPNLKFLRESGVGDSTIIRLLLSNPTRLYTSQSQLSETVELLKGMGMDPKLGIFGTAIETIGAMTKETWGSKIDAYKKWGWSEELILTAFTKAPRCMGLSVRKLDENMDYYVNKMGFDALDIARKPSLLLYSFKKRIVPRGSVLCALLSKGLIKSRCLSKAVQMSNELFEKKFLVPYKEEAPELMELYWGKIERAGLKNENPMETSTTSGACNNGFPQFS
ncbi:Transcription termination factor MTERF8, chloroplastic [Linum perenne]